MMMQAERGEFSPADIQDMPLTPAGSLPTDLDDDRDDERADENEIPA